MLTVAEALEELEQRLGTAPRAAHSRFVGYAMRRVAIELGADATLWELTGLCHDLDFEATRHAPHLHGPMAADWLQGRLPAEALLAIAAHDHRAGMSCDLPICAALKMTDALAVIAESLTSPVLPAPADLAIHFDKRPWLVPLLLDNAERLLVPVALLSDIVFQSGYVNRA
jgi:predicted hydrolase (HD superfamily)